MSSEMPLQTDSRLHGQVVGALHTSDESMVARDTALEARLKGQANDASELVSVLMRSLPLQIKSVLDGQNLLSRLSLEDSSECLDLNRDTQAVET